MCTCLTVSSATCLQAPFTSEDPTNQPEGKAGKTGCQSHGSADRADPVLVLALWSTAANTWGRDLGTSLCPVLGVTTVTSPHCLLDMEALLFPNPIKCFTQRATEAGREPHLVLGSEYVCSILYH